MGRRLLSHLAAPTFSVPAFSSDTPIATPAPNFSSCPIVLVNTSSRPSLWKMCLKSCSSPEQRDLQCCRTFHAVVICRLEALSDTDAMCFLLNTEKRHPLKGEGEKESLLLFFNSWGGTDISQLMVDSHSLHFQRTWDCSYALKPSSQTEPTRRTQNSFFPQSLWDSDTRKVLSRSALQRTLSITVTFTKAAPPSPACGCFCRHHSSLYTTPNVWTAVGWARPQNWSALK